MSNLPNSHPPGSPVLPYDVECAILDQLSHDRVALAACSLVCRGWTRIAQRHLFRSIYIIIPRRWIRNGRNEFVLEDFQQILHESRHLAKFIRTIRIDGGRYRIAHIAAHVRRILRRARHLHTVTLSDMLVRPDEVINKPPHASIDTLNLWGLGFTTPNALLRILGNFTRIAKLNICRGEEISGEAAEPGFSVSPSTVPVIESVSLIDVPMYLLELLRSALCVSSLADGALTSIHISIAKPSGVNTFLLPCLEYARDHILALYLTVDRPMFREYPETFAEPWDALASFIASCTGLRELIFFIEGHDGHEDEGPYAAYVENVLEAYLLLLGSPPPSTRSIDFMVRQPRSADGARTAQVILDAVAGAGEHWGTLDAALSASPALTRLAFLFYDDEDEDGDLAKADRARFSSALEGVLPKTVAKGVSVTAQ